MGISDQPPPPASHQLLLSVPASLVINIISGGQQVPSGPADLPGGGNVGRGAGVGIFTVARLAGLIGLTLSREAG